MTQAMKCGITTVIVIFAAILTFWNGSPVRADRRWLLDTIAAGMILVMWTFPKAGF
jgi:hypothetical protein